MVALVKTAAPIGFDGSIIEVESDATNGLPTLQIVGLGSKAIDEAKERVRSAIANSLLEFPKKRITINLAPAELPKSGALYDLPIALSILCVSGQLKQTELEQALFAGELALDGNVRPIRGAINIVETAKKAGFKRIYLPVGNVDQANLLGGIEVIGVTSLKQLYLHLKGEQVLSPIPAAPLVITARPAKHPLLDDIYGQEQAKRALIIAAAGHHNILLAGPPGAGKSMLAKALVNLLPELSIDEQVAVTKLYSLAGEIDEDIITHRPFRTPHHTASLIALIGGGGHARPGEISLAHTGVLFLDEIPEYPRIAIEALRQPLEDKMVAISRANNRAVYPADFMLVATMNPCPCGYLGDSTKECSCTPTQILAYQKRLSGPMLDRIDLRVNVSRVSHESLLYTNSLIKSQQVTAHEMITQALEIQTHRYNSSIVYNASLTSNDIKKYISMTHDVKKLLTAAATTLSLSARSYFKVIKVARTIADLAGENDVLASHISEALQYR